MPVIPEIILYLSVPPFAVSPAAFIKNLSGNLIVGSAAETNEFFGLAQNCYF